MNRLNKFLSVATLAALPLVGGVAIATPHSASLAQCREFASQPMMGDVSRGNMHLLCGSGGGDPGPLGGDGGACLGLPGGCR
jgi:hypothetical protein